MANLRFQDTGILGMAAAVPRQVVDNNQFGHELGVENMEEVIGKIGIKERRKADENTCASDLCLAAAERLISDLNIDRNEIGLVIFVTQTPDYRMPATSILLQDRLKLPKATMAFDLNLGCSGFVYGLSVVNSIMQQNHIKKALLLDGETRTKAYSQKDKKTAFLFGDGGIAALVNKDKKYGSSYFSLNSDGSRHELIKTPAGGYRVPSSPETVKEKVVDDEGNIKSMEHGEMQGADVFNFVIREVPLDIKGLYDFAGISKEEIDFFLFHQANQYMNSYLAKKLKLEKEKIPSSIEKFGNTSSVSIPLTMVSQLKDRLEGQNKLLLSGFGTGLSWATAIINVEDCHISPLVEV